VEQKTIAARIAAKVDTSAGPDACHLWTGSVMKANGYPQISTISPKTGKRTMRNVHVVAFELANGPIPDGQIVLHARGCGKRCCRPDHLRLGTHAENAKDKIAEGRANKRLRKAEVIEIVALHQRYRVSSAELATRFGVDPSVTRRILRGESWSATTKIERHRGVGGRRRKSEVIRVPVPPKFATYAYAKFTVYGGIAL
jgi:hypothetical protein